MIILTSNAYYITSSTTLGKRGQSFSNIAHESIKN